MPDEKKSPSELSVEIFAARVAADGTIPQSVRDAVIANRDKGTPALLDAIKKSVGGADEA